MKVFFRSLLTVSTVLAFAGAAFGSTLGSDNASNYYSTGWYSGSNNGTGFGAWSFSNGNGGATGDFLGDSTTLGGSGANSGGANINSNTQPNSSPLSFGMYANGTGTNGSPFANASRPFAGGSLNTGQDFSCDIAVNYRNGAKGIDVKGADGATIFTFDVTNDDYLVLNTTGTNGSIGNSYSANTAFHLDIYQTSATGGSWTLTRSGGVADLDTGTYTGDATSFNLFVTGTDGGDQNNLFANNFAIAVPEPSTWLAGCLLVGVVGYRLRRSLRSGPLVAA